MSVFLSPIGNSGIPFFTTQGVILSGGKINTYQAGSTTPAATYTDNTGGTPNANPIILNSAGLPPSQIWLTSGQSYKFVITDSNDNVLQTQDNIRGVNDAATSASEWVTTGIIPTYASGTSFSTAGNTTNTFTVGRRIRAAVTAGTVYGTVTASSFSSSTTVTVRIDSGALDSGLSAVDVGLLGIINGSTPAYPASVVVTAHDPTPLTAAGVFGSYTEVIDNGNNFNPSTGVFTAPYTAQYIVCYIAAITFGGATATMTVSWRKNGSDQRGVTAQATSSSNSQCATFFEIVNLSLSDTVDLHLSSITGASAAALIFDFSIARIA